MKVTTKYYISLTLTLLAYITVSKVVFDKVNEKQQLVVDELFHIPQGIAYCNGNYSHWDSKITTLPGLYILSSVIGNVLPCNTYNLRLVNLIGSSFNFILFASILKYIYWTLMENQFKIVLQALSLAILPPLYFFSHVYYTDTLSLMFLLLYFRICIVNRSKWFILIFGAASVLMRQTNIVWVGMVMGHKMLDIFIRSSRVYGNSYLSYSRLDKKSIIAHDLDSSKLKKYYSLTDLIISIKYHISTCFRTVFMYVSYKDMFVITQQFIVLLLFVLFIYVNGSIVVGDKQAHTPTVHLPQMLYFLLFYGVFGLSYVLAKFFSTLKLMFHNKAMVLMSAIVMAVTVHFNTIVHPYLLADNRHYIFYVWNRWFGKYEYAPYATIPMYIFLLFSLYDNLENQNCIAFLFPYTICLFFVLALQKLLDIRYFLIPYIILRFRFVRPSYKVVLFEFVWYLALNIITFNVFFTKEIVWKNFNETQRIIW